MILKSYHQKTGIFKTRWCHLYLIAGILVVVYLNITKPIIDTIPSVSPPAPLIKLLAFIMTAVGVVMQHPFPHTFQQILEQL